MISSQMAKKLLGGAVRTAGVAFEAARHVAWYLSYHIEGRTRDVRERRRS